MVTLLSNAALNKAKNDDQLKLINTLLISTVHMRMLASHYTKKTKAIATMGCIATAVSIFGSVFLQANINLISVTIIASLMATMASDVLHRRTIYDGKYDGAETSKHIADCLKQRKCQ